MKFMRRFLGIFVMLAGVLGLVLSLAGLVMVWVVKPTVAGYLDSTILVLNDSVDTSQQAMEITSEALGATVSSIDALSSMLENTADSINDTKPVLEKVDTIMGDTLPATLESASRSLKGAQQAAGVLDGAIQSLESFQFLLSGTPLLSALVDAPAKAYDPDVPLADSLGGLVDSLEGLPDIFSEMSDDLAKADDNLETIQDNLTTMADSVGLISSSLGEYQDMIGESMESTEDVQAMLTDLQDKQISILSGAAAVLSLFFLWLLAAQVVILSQGWELYQGTAGRLEGDGDED